MQSKIIFGILKIVVFTVSGRCFVNALNAYGKVDATNLSNNNKPMRYR